MTIGIDASRANRDNKTGTEWYSWHLIEEFKKIVPTDDKVFLYTNIPLKGDLGKCPENFQEKILSWPPRYLWTQLRLWWELFVNPPDVLFVPAHTIPFLPIPRRTKVIVTVHDVGFRHFPELYKPIQVWYHELTMRKIKKRADVILTISQFSKNEIMKYYGVAESRIKISYLGYDQDQYNAKEEIKKDLLQEVLNKYRITLPYLLYVGRLEKKKNIGNIVKAFALVKEQFPELKLVLAGNSGNQFEAIKEIIANQKLENEIILPGYAAVEDLPTLIKGAAIFLFPTLYEGFGLPILEAMACGTSVITSDLDPHREVAGGAAALVDPYDAAVLGEKIAEVLNDHDYRQSLIAKGKQRAEEFSWPRTAAATLLIIQQAGKNA